MLKDKNELSELNARNNVQKYLTSINHFNSRLKDRLQKLKETTTELDQALTSIEEKENQIDISTDADVTANKLKP